MVIEKDYLSRGNEFNSQHPILDGKFSHLCVVKIGLLFERPKLNKKRPEMSHF